MVPGSITIGLNSRPRCRSRGGISSGLKNSFGRVCIVTRVGVSLFYSEEWYAHIDGQCGGQSVKKGCGGCGVL